ncbi:MAG: PPC domain-containing protein [Candidatus Caldarchaeum sp.]
MSSVIAGHPWASGYEWSVNAYSASLALNYTLYRHAVPATSLVDMEAGGDVPGDAPGAVSVPDPAAPWIIAAEISPSGDQDWFKFFASAGQKIWIVMDGSPNLRTGPHDDDSSSLDGVIELRTDTGALIWSNDSGYGSPQPNAETRIHTITTSGVYILVVKGYGTETHAYHLVACVVP